MSRRRTRPAAGAHASGVWLFTPEGAVVHRGERTAVVADVHLGYEWARGAAGDCVPAHSWFRRHPPSVMRNPTN